MEKGPLMQAAEEAEQRVADDDITLTPRVYPKIFEGATLGEAPNETCVLVEANLKSWEDVRIKFAKLSSPQLQELLKLHGVEVPAGKERRIEKCVPIFNNIVRRSRLVLAKKLKEIAADETRLAKQPAAITFIQSVFRGNVGRKIAGKKMEALEATRERGRTAKMVADTWRRAKEPEIECAVVWLHGQGETESWQIQFRNYKVPEKAGRCRWIWPRAEVSPCTYRGGALTTQWFDTLEFPICSGYRGVPDRKRLPEDSDQVQAAILKVNAALDALVAEGVPACNIILGGFGQGAALASVAGLYYPEVLAGVVLISGWVPCVEEVAKPPVPKDSDVAFLEVPKMPKLPPLENRERSHMLWCHGSLDAVVKPDIAMAHSKVLRRLGVKVKRQLFPETGFGNTPEVMETVENFISKRIVEGRLPPEEVEEEKGPRDGKAIVAEAQEMLQAMEAQRSQAAQGAGSRQPSLRLVERRSTEDYIQGNEGGA